MSELNEIKKLTTLGTSSIKEYRYTPEGISIEIISWAYVIVVPVYVGTYLCRYFIIEEFYYYQITITFFIDI